MYKKMLNNKREGGGRYAIFFVSVALLPVLVKFYILWYVSSVKKLYLYLKPQKILINIIHRVQKF